MSAGLIVDRRSLIVIGLASLLVSPAAFAKVPSKIKVEDVLRVLKHHTDPTPEDLKVAGSGVANVLADLVGRGRLDTELRIRAAHALGRYPGSQAAIVLGSTVSNPEEKLEIRSAAMLGLARAKGVQSLDKLSEFLKNESTALRIGAARAIGAIGSDGARTLLMNAMHHEKVIEVRLAIDEALKTIR